MTCWVPALQGENQEKLRHSEARAAQADRAAKVGEPGVLGLGKWWENDGKTWENLGIWWQNDGKT